MLVVVGLVLVLIALLLPALQMVRGVANTTTCASRLRNIGGAVTMFCSDNKTIYPTTLGSGAYRTDNWLFWEPGRNFDQSAIAPYMGAKGATLRNMFICPAQPTDDQVGYQGGAAYPFTYSMNYSVWAYYPLAMHSVHNASQKVLVYDENQNADDDQFSYTTPRDTLAARHGVISSQSANLNGSGQNNYQRAAGNVLFCDGHVGLVDNNYCHDPAFNDLKAP